jgi:hypothetical protein
MPLSSFVTQDIRALLDRKLITRAGFIGLVLAAGGIGLFVLLWVVLGNAGIDTFARLMIAICIPPALIALAVGVYFLVTRAK